LAPRPHNSGHFSLDACDCSQFEMQVRTVCGLAIHEPRLLGPCAMINLLGKHVDRLDVPRLASLSGVKLHLYGKKRVEPRRKMGHVTVLGTDTEAIDRTLARIEELIGEKLGAGNPASPMELSR
ncbi:MAG: 5-(carboxyamino)imidazole ribonucleotide synthase, partial [Bacteroidota bacterium]